MTGRHFGGQLIVLGPIRFVRSTTPFFFFVSAIQHGLAVFPRGTLISSMTT
ncbi:hypothetical protein [Burkholderia vietnamiensis]|uniref:Uncharacterized protein n=1 Tax=Burkholderia vietnamiensis TaxID=60552 RepID=A0AAW7T887_BURVI|nr:hypothetical protein [Burkholderia vietnamiensis]MDN7798061.1 hypothetical protein [Burkholderia vietnamiensis]MDN8034574.1 hypothetical protein [Burkholderia vietnamiensis]HDR8967128.1 hypothetical protein [Burkholderia vietnamiensis]HDR9072618.1 hypothetical protein [Burkholderia vietnamiensis]HDR9190271.1 hypothetical protein [Burkholderia vietnamiensis]